MSDAKHPNDQQTTKCIAGTPTTNPPRGQLDVALRA
jgi:hypothetical protein